MNVRSAAALVYARVQRGRTPCLMLVWVSVHLLVAVPTPADACGCVWTPNQCQNVLTADAVFEATVDSIELGALSPPSRTSVPWNDVRVVTLRDVRALRGEASTTVVTPYAGSACGYEFRAGTRYLIVAHRLPDGRLSVNSCGLTRPLTEGDGLRGYIDTLEASGAQMRVWGRVRTSSVPGTGFGGDVDPVPGARVTVTGSEERSVMTGADGRYVLADLPHGSYTVRVTMPDARPEIGDVEPEAFALDEDTAHACAALDFFAPYRFGGVISGVVTDGGNRPLRGVLVRLRRVDQLDGSTVGGGGFAKTDATGHYTFDNRPPGRYVVGISLGHGRPSPMWPYPPGLARTADGEAVFSLSLGGHVELLPIRARPAGHVTVSATVRDSAGSPVAGIEVRPDRLGEWGQADPVTRVKTDAEGRVELRLWEGERYRIVIGPRFAPDAETEFVAGNRELEITLRR